MTETEFRPSPEDIKGNHVFMGTEDVDSAYEAQKNSEIEDAKDALETAQELLAKAKENEYTDKEAAEKLVEMRQNELDKVMAKYDKNQTSH